MISQELQNLCRISESIDNYQTHTQKVDYKTERAVRHANIILWTSYMLKSNDYYYYIFDKFGNEKSHIKNNDENRLKILSCTNKTEILELFSI